MSKRIGRGAVYIFVLNSLQFIIGIIFYNILSNVLSPRDIGLLSTFFFIYLLASLISNLSLPVAGAKFLAEFLGKEDGEKSSAVVKTIIKIVLLSSSALFITSFVSIFVIQIIWHPFEDILILLLVTFSAAFFASLRQTYMGFIQGLQLFGRFAIANVTAVVGVRLLGIILVIWNFGLIGVFMGFLGGELIALLLAISFYHGHLPKPKYAYNSALLLKFSLPVLAMTLSTMFSDWADRVLYLALSSDLEMLGIYDLAIRAASSLVMIWAVIDVVLLPVFSETFGKGGDERLSQLLKRALRYLAFMIFPASLGLAAISRTAMTLLYQKSYATGMIPLTVLAIFAIFAAFSAIFSSSLKSIGETSVFVKISLTSIIVDVIVVIVTTPILGILGAAFGRAATLVVNFTLISRELRRRMRIDVDFKGLWKAAASSVVMVIPILAFENLYSETFTNPFICLAAEVSIGVFAYLAALLLFRALRREDFENLKEIMPRSFLRLITFLEKIFIYWG